MSEAITYRVILDKLTQHMLTVECKIKQPNENGQIVSLPAWVPGSYMIRDYAKHLVDISAESHSGPVDMTKIEKNTWQCAPCNGELLIRYHVYCFDLTPRGAYVDHSRVFFDGCRVFLVVDGEEEQTRSVEIVKPVGESCKSWTCETSMTPLKVNQHGFGIYIANNHLELIDHPFAVGILNRFDFMVAGVPHSLVVTSPAAADWPRVVRDIEKLCTAHVNFFGEIPSMLRYVFILNVLGKGYGGIEHRASCSLLCARNDLPIIDDPIQSDEYSTLLGLISHEYFHLWNVKRIKPEVFTNLDLKAEVYTRQLWIFEGITAYYDNLNLVRAGILDPVNYIKFLQKDLSSLLQNPGANMQTLDDSSFDAWIKYYQPDENSINSSVSYYLKGSIVAMALDLLIIKNSARKQSLADIMQILWQQYGKTGLGVPEFYFEHITFEVTGENYADFFALALRSCEELPLAELLLEVGLIYKIVDAEFMDNLGVKFSADPGKLMVRSVLSNSALEQAGLAANDTIIAVNNIAVTQNNISSTLLRFKSQGQVKLQVFRNDLLIELVLLFPGYTTTVCQLEFALNPTETQLQNRRKWLGV